VLAPATPDNLILAADGLSVSGTAEAGSTIKVYGPNGVLLGSSPVTNDGTFTVNLGSAQANGEVLQVSATGPMAPYRCPLPYRPGHHGTATPHRPGVVQRRPGTQWPR
jgi:hypothetical protein